MNRSTIASFRNLWFLKKYIKYNNADLYAINPYSVQTFNQSERTTLKNNIKFSFDSIYDYACSYRTNINYGISIDCREFEDLCSNTIKICFVCNKERPFTDDVIELINLSHKEKERVVLEMMGNICERGYPLDVYDLKEWTKKKIYEYDEMDISEQIYINHGLEINICIDLVKQSRVPYKRDYILDILDNVDQRDNCYLLNPEKHKGFISDYHPFTGIITNTKTDTSTIKTAKNYGLEVLECNDPIAITGRVKYD